MGWKELAQRPLVSMRATGSGGGLARRGDTIADGAGMRDAPEVVVRARMVRTGESPIVGCVET